MTPETNPQLANLLAQIAAVENTIAALKADGFEVEGHCYLKISRDGQVLYEETHYFNPTPSSAASLR